ncbi:MAG TPA: YceI family protein [Solirubrobacteraceae bacterium]|nr:YceI family protein [Solirubrobacteraceae bacterium]
MSTPETPLQAALPVGSWQVDEAAGQLGFKVKTMWGLSTVKGRFERYEGELEVTPDGARGTLRIDAASLNTKNRMRDTHLRSADFFDVEQHPTVSFELRSTTSGGPLLTVKGELEVAGKPVSLEFPLTLERLDGDRVRLVGEVSVTREQAGLTWNRMGMIGEVAELSADIVLLRSGAGAPAAQPPSAG